MLNSKQRYWRNEK